MKLPEDFFFSQSNLQDYVDCPYRFYLRHFLKVKWPALLVDDALTYERRAQTGARFHQFIQQYLLGIPESRISELVAADPAAEISLWWENFLQTISPQIEGKKFVETVLTASLNGHFLLGKFDLILVKPNKKIEIYDWKTSHKTPRRDWLMNRIQTRLYRLLLSEASTELTGEQLVDPDQVNMVYWFANQSQSPIALPYSKQAYAADYAYITKLTQEISDREEAQFFRTEDLMKCRYCVYRSHCDRGTQAGDLASFDDFESGREAFELDIEFDQLGEIAF
jgi:RecB family exonuclease